MIRSNFRNQGFKRYFFNTFWMMSEKLIRMFLNLFVIVFVARYLGPDRFGILNYAISFVYLFLGIALLGLDNIVVRNLVLSPEDSDRILGTSFYLKVLGSLILLGLISISLHFTSNDRLTKTIIIIIAGGMLFKSFGVIDFYFQAKVNARYVTISQMCSSFASVAFQIALLLYQAPLVYFAWALVLENGIFCISLVFMYFKQRLSVFKWKFNWALALTLLRDSWPLMLSHVMILIQMRIDQVMIKELFNTEMVGHYAAAVRLSEAWYFIPMAITASLFPAILNARNTNKELYHDRLQKLYDLMLWIALIVAIPITFLSDYVICFLYGEEYIMASGALKIHIWAGIFVFLGVAISRYLLAENLMIITLRQAVVGCAFNIILNSIFIPVYGIKGAAWATLISYVIALSSICHNKKGRKAFYMMLRSFLLIKTLKKLV